MLVKQVRDCPSVIASEAMEQCHMSGLNVYIHNNNQAKLTENQTSSSYWGHCTELYLQDGRTALHVAAKKGLTQAAAQLLKVKADPNLLDKVCITKVALHN